MYQISGELLIHHHHILAKQAQHVVRTAGRVGTARSVEEETRNAELNGNRYPEWWGDFS